MKRFKNFIMTFAFAALVVAPVGVAVIPQSAFAAAPATAEDCSHRILGMPTWFRGLVKVDNGQCVTRSPSELNSAPGANDGLQVFIWRVALNLIEIALFIVGYIALFFVLFGGFQFLTGGSNPGQTEKARQTILNAVIGLAISMASIAVVNLIFRVING